MAAPHVKTTYFIRSLTKGITDLRTVVYAIREGDLKGPLAVLPAIGAFPKGRARGDKPGEIVEDQISTDVYWPCRMPRELVKTLAAISEQEAILLYPEIAEKIRTAGRIFPQPELTRAFRATAHLQVESGAITNMDTATRLHIAAMLLLEKFLGREWLDRHVWPSNYNPSSYLRSGTKEVAEAAVQSLRLTDLAEMILNFRGVDGFESRLEKLRSAKADVEGLISELHAVKVLALSGYGLAFKEEAGSTASVYDLDYQEPGRPEVGAAELKSKVLRHELTEEGLVRSLRRANKQLPNIGLRMIILTLPEWTPGMNFTSEEKRVIDGTVHSFLRQHPGVDRIIAVSPRLNVNREKDSVTPALWCTDYKNWWSVRPTPRTSMIQWEGDDASVFWIHLRTLI